MMAKLNLQSIRTDFEQQDNRIYFNAGLVGFPAKSVWEKTQAFYRQLHYASETDYFRIFDELNALWDATAPAFIHCDASEITGVPNTTMGMNYITQSLPWQPGDNVVINELEFMSQNIAFFHFHKKFGFEVRVAKRSGYEVPAENIIELIDERTRLVALSHVSFATGYRHDVATIAEAAHKKGALVALDAIQALGPLHVNVQQLDVDFLTGGSSKWMMSLPGWGVLYVRKSIIEQLTRPVAGFLGLENPEQAIHDWCEGLDFVKNYPITRNRIDKFRVSTENILAKIALAYSMQNFMALGRDAIEAHILDLSGYLIEALKARGQLVRTSSLAARRAGIVSFEPKKVIPDFQQKLEKENIYLSRRGGGIRVSLHVYNTRQEVDRLVDVVEKLCK